MKGAHLLTHGLAKTPEHNAWCLMKARCYNKRHPRWPEWGGKGIGVCAEWRNDFMAFFLFIGERPSPAHSVDRIDGTKDYQPGNVRWATKMEQSNNRPSFCRSIEYRGKRQTLAEWAREVGLNRECLKYRLDEGWPIERAMTQPSKAISAVVHGAKP